MDCTNIYYTADLLYLKIKTNDIVLKYQHNKVNIWMHEANTFSKLLREPQRKIVIVFIANPVAFDIILIGVL